MIDVTSVGSKAVRNMAERVDLPMSHAVFVKVHQTLEVFSTRKEGSQSSGRTHLKNLVNEIANFPDVFKRGVIDGPQEWHRHERIVPIVRIDERVEDGDTRVLGVLGQRRGWVA